jgi:CHAT domain-containing protein
VAKSPATTDELDRLVSDYLEQLKEGAGVDELADQEKSLYQLLIEPAEGIIQPGVKLCIVPDKALHLLPFAPLMDQAGHYLIAKCAITYSPSASVLIRCIREAKRKSMQPGNKTLIVGDPSFDRDRFPRLANLSSARDEATAIRSFYPGSKLLVGDEATKTVVRSELKSCQIFHFAGHCVIDERSPWQAALLLAKPRIPDDTHGVQLTNSQTGMTDQDELLYLQEAYELEMPHLKLAVLSACESGLGRFYRGEGIVSLVRPFIAARVPTVVATLWAVESQSTDEFMEMFHRLRSSGAISTGDALRQTQLKIVEQNPDRSPYYWAAFIVEGSDAN